MVASICAKSTLINTTQQKEKEKEEEKQELMFDCLAISRHK